MEHAMGMLYSQHTEGERNQIYALKQAGVSNRGIANILLRDVTTIGREIRRNRGEREYRPRQANLKAQERRRVPQSKKMTEPTLRRSSARSIRPNRSVVRCV